MANGLSYLEAMGVLHLNLAAKNVLVIKQEEIFSVKISDYGQVNLETFNIEDLKIPVRW